MILLDRFMGPFFLGLNYLLPTEKSKEEKTF